MARQNLQRKSKTMVLPLSLSTFLFTISLLTLILQFPTAKPATPATGRRLRQLSVDYYAKTCPNLEQLVASVTSHQFKVSPISGPATIRLFFHDCFVEGCDGSILISTSPGSREKAEKDAEDNKDMRPEGYDTVYKAKSLVGTTCPAAAVSCADILAVAARDFVHLAGGPYYPVKKGRWDGRISKSSTVARNIPRSNSTVDELVSLFRSKNLSIRDMVVLSGAHSIGFAHCKQFVGRLYDYKGKKGPDPSMDLRLVKALRMSCPRYGGNDDVVAPFDATTPFLFDNAYYGNLEGGLGLLGSDQGLWADSRTKAVVEEMGKDKGRFFEAFAAAMERMGAVGVKRGRRHGERRRDCRFHDS